MQLVSRALGVFLISLALFNTPAIAQRQLYQAAAIPCFVDTDGSDELSCFSCPSGQAPATVFVHGAAYDTTLTQVCLTNLGNYNPETGVRTTTNYDAARRAWVLNGKYLQTDVQTLAPTFPRLGSPTNTFVVNPAGGAGFTPRLATVAGSEVHLYYYINDYRSRFLNAAFVNGLSLGTDFTSNLLNRQFRPDLQGLVNARLPKFIPQELTTVGLWSSDSTTNNFTSPTQQRSVVTDSLNTIALDPDFVIGEYSGVASNWVTNGTARWPVDPTWGTVGNTSWRTDIRPALLEGFKLWNAYRYTGHKELYKYAITVLRRWSGYSCGGTSRPACDKGWDIDNSMMYLDTADPVLNNPSNPGWPAANSDDTLLFPFLVRSGVGTGHFGPQNGSLGGMFIAAVFYDISNEVGLGDFKADQLFWKTISLIDPAQSISMTTFGQRVQAAARSLWPTPGNPALSLYEQDLVDVLSSRGIRMNGVANFTDNIPAAIGTAANPGPGALTNPNAQGLGSALPESQRNSSTGYNFLSYFSNSYNVATAGTQYTTYQFYKYSKYGACDSLDLTNGTINTVSTNNPVMNYDGSLAVRYTGRSLGNMLLSSPGTSLTFLRRRQSCVTDADGYYPKDTRPLGFRVVKAIPNGFTYAVQRIGDVAGNRIAYRLTIIDPSLTLTGPNTGPATYSWRFTEYDGNVANFTGQVVTYNALKDQPFTLFVERNRGGQLDNISLRERGNDLDRNSGRQFNQDFWNPGYPVGFDTLINRRMVEGHGSYNSALNPVGGAFGVQGRRWTTPNATVQPLRFSSVAHGLGSGNNQGGPYHFDQAVYYNACIWGSRDNVTNFPGCHSDQASGDYEVQLPFTQVGIDLNNPFAVVTAGGYPGYLWTANYPADWRLQPNREYYFGSHISASVINNGYSYNVCSYVQAAGTAGQANDRSDWLAGANWSGQSGAPNPQTMRSYLSSAGSVSNCTYAAYRFEGQTVP